MSDKKSIPACPYSDRTDCFGRRNKIDGEPGEKCFALVKTDFKYHECPFYKTNEEYKEGLRIYGGLRLK